MTKEIIICLAFILCQVEATAQNPDTLGLTDFTADILEDENSTAFFDFLDELFHVKIDLNTATKSDLLKIHGVSSDEADKILDYRGKNSRFLSPGEIYLIPGIPYHTLRKIYPFITVTAETDRKLFRGFLSEKITFNTPIEPNPNYEGDKYKSVLRVKSGYNNSVKLGLIIEKDPYEKNYSDHAAGYITYSANKNLNLLFGDFTIESPGGLAFSDPFPKFLSAGGSSFSGIYKIKSFAGAEENKFFRGITIQNSGRFYNLLGFYSRKKADGFYNTMSNNWVFAGDGLHRSPLEIDRKDNITLLSGGLMGNIELADGISAGASIHFGSAMSAQFSEKFIQQAVSGGITKKKISVNAELVNFNGEMDFLSELELNSGGFRPRILMRILQSDELNYYSETYRESSKKFNETGVGLFVPLSKGKFNSSIQLDFFSAKERKNAIPDSDGLRLYLISSYSIDSSNKINVKFSYKTKRELLNTGYSATYRYNDTYNGVIGLVTNFSRKTIIRTLVNFKVYTPEYLPPATGRAFKAEADFRTKSSWRFLMGGIIFQNDEFATTSYFFETNLLDAPSLKSVSGKGIYTYFSCQAAFGDYFTLAARISQENGTGTSGAQKDRFHFSLIISASNF